MRRSSRCLTNDLHFTLLELDQAFYHFKVDGNSLHIKDIECSIWVDHRVERIKRIYIRSHSSPFTTNKTNRCEVKKKRANEREKKKIKAKRGNWNGDFWHANSSRLIYNLASTLIILTTTNDSSLVLFPLFIVSHHFWLNYMSKDEY